MSSYMYSNSSQPGFAPRSGRGGHSQIKTSNESRSMDEGIAFTGAVVNLKDQLDKHPVPSSLKLSNVEAVAAYSWSDEKKPTIIVPGSPPIWNSKPMPFQVARDSGIQYIDQNGYRVPSHPMAPLILAVQHLKHNHPFKDYDVISDRNNLRKLLRWIDGTAADRDFRIDVDIVGEKTVVLQRWEEKHYQIGGRGFGINFEHAATNEAVGCKNATGHHRIISYDFNGLKMLLRFEVDACLPSKPAALPPKLKAGDDFGTLLDGLVISNKTVPIETPVKGGIVSIVKGGSLVSQDSLIEMTTRSTRSLESFNWADPFPQIYLSQTPHLYVAVHNNGKFHQLQKYKLGENELKWIESQCEPSLKKLHSVLLGIAEKAREAARKSHKLSLVCRGGVMRVHERTDEKTCHLLPKELRDLFSLPAEKTPEPGANDVVKAKVE